MDILLNGLPIPVSRGCTVRELLERESLADRRVAVEINGAIVPATAHAGRVLSEGDRVEIVHALGGG